MRKIILSEQKTNALIREIKEKILKNVNYRQDSVTGEGLVRLHSHKQVNNFILFQIYQDWNAHLSKIIHPYFDFDHPDVQESLGRFLNTVSRHIRIKREDMEILVERAVFNSLRLILDPEDAFLKFFFASQLSISVSLLKKHAMYFSDYDFIIQSILLHHEKNNIQEVRRDDFMQKFNKVVEIFEKKEGKSFIEYQKHLFMNFTGSDLAQILEREKAAAAVTPPERKILSSQPVVKKIETPVTPPPLVQPVEKVEPVKPVEQPKFETPVEPPFTPVVTEKIIPPVSEDNKVPIPQIEEQPQIQPPQVITPQIILPEPEVVEAPIPQNQDQQKSIADQFVSREEEKNSSLNERFNTAQEKPIWEKAAEQKPVEEIISSIPPVPEPFKSTLVESDVKNPPIEKEVIVPNTGAINLVGSDEKSQQENVPVFERKETIADRFREKSAGVNLNEKVKGGKSIRIEHIPVHKQFQFVQKVFGGSSVRFKVMLDKINETQSPGEIDTLLEKYIFEEGKVDRNDKVTQEFVQLAKARFD